jgi:alkane 1-monooxygenase
LSFSEPGNESFKPFIFISIVYALFPVLDELFSLDERNPSPEERRQLEKDDGYFRMALYVAMILSWMANIKLCVNFSKVELGWGNLFTTFGAIFISSNLYAAQFAVAHEVMHKPGKFYRILGTLHMSNLYYTHFTYHHLYRHHHQVATPEDPSSARRGQNVYSFIYSCILNSLRGVYDDEKRAGKSFFANYAVLSVAGSVAFAAGLYLLFGLQAMILHSLMAIGAVVYLEAINYIEHYGLSRKRLAGGEYEKVSILHSWNAPHRFTNYLLFKLQRHSDHHENSSKPFQTLVSMDQSPFMPHGYTLMILMSFFPSVRPSPRRSGSGSWTPSPTPTSSSLPTGARESTRGSWKSHSRKPASSSSKSPSAPSCPSPSPSPASSDMITLSTFFVIDS